MGAFRQATGLSPIVAGTLCGILTTWVTFLPCFLWVFLGAPFSSAFAASALSGALSTIPAAVVGVVLNLAIWFGIHTLFGRVERLRAGWLDFDVFQLASVNLQALVLTAVALVAVSASRWGRYGCWPVCSIAYGFA